MADGGYYLEPEQKYNILVVDGKHMIQLLDEDGMSYEIIELPLDPLHKKGVNNAKQSKLANTSAD